MMLSTLLSAVPLLVGGPSAPEPVGTLAIRVGRAETVANGPIDNAVILIEGGKIVIVGEDLPIERGIPVLDRPNWVVMPGLVNCYSRAGMDSRVSGANTPQALASGELYPDQDVYGDLLELGVTTLGLYPAGNGMPGQAVAVRPHGDSKEEMILADGVYIKIGIGASAKSKKALRDAFGKVDDHQEKVEKAREKWEKDQEKKNKKKKSKKDDDEDEKEDEKDDSKASETFEPPAPDEKVQPFIDLRAKKLSALMRVRKAADYLHFIDALGEEDIEWSLRAPLRDDIDFFKVADKVGEAEALVVFDPRVTLQPSTRRERNIPAEFQRAGARVALVPPSDSLRGHRDWLRSVAHLVACGLDRQAGLAAITLHAAAVIGLEERLGSIEPGKDANLVFFDGDPFEPSSQIQAVMLEGEFVHGELAW